VHSAGLVQLADMAEVLRIAAVVVRIVVAGVVSTAAPAEVVDVLQVVPAGVVAVP